MAQRPGYFRRRINSFGFAFKGLWAFIRSEEHAHIHLLAALVVTIAGMYTGLNALEWTAITGAIGLVFVAEMANTAIERLTDLVHPHFDERAGKVKDIAAGGVLVAACVAVLIAAGVFLPHWL